MTDVISVPIDLITTPLFDKKHNVSYSDSDFNGSNVWQIVLSGVCPTNISDCLNSSTGVLNSSVSADAFFDIALTLVEADEYNSHVEITKNVSISLSEDIDVKGIFLRKKSNGFVLMAMVNSTPMRFCDGVTFEAGNTLFVKRRNG